MIVPFCFVFMITGTRACNMTVHPEYVTKKEGETATLYCNANMSISRNTSANVTVITSVGANTSAIASTSTCVIASTSTKTVSASVIASRGTSVNASMYATVSAGVSASVSTKSVSVSVSPSVSAKSVSASSSISTVSTTSVTESCSCNHPAPTINCPWKVSWNPIGHSRISFGACNESLTIKNITRADTGVYRCVARDNLGRVISDKNVTLDVLCK